MKTEKQKTLERAGRKIGTADEFLDLTPEKSALVSIRLALVVTTHAKAVHSTCGPS